MKAVARGFFTPLCRSTPSELHQSHDNDSHVDCEIQTINYYLRCYELLENPNEEKIFV